MTEKQFDVLLHDVFAEFGADYIAVPEKMSQSHTFSRAFEKKMKRLYCKRRIAFPVVRLPIRRAAVVLVIMFLGTFLVASGNPSVHNQYPGFTTVEYKRYTIVRSEPGQDAPEHFEVIYELTGLPDNIGLVDDYSTLGFRSMTFEDEEAHINVDFHQSLKPRFKTYINTEGFPMHRALINGKDGYFIEMFGASHYLMWNDDDYIFSLMIEFDDRYYTREEERELVKPILENLKIVQKEEVIVPSASMLEEQKSDNCFTKNKQKVLYDGIKIVEIVE